MQADHNKAILQPAVLSLIVPVRRLLWMTPEVEIKGFGWLSDNQFTG